MTMGDFKCGGPHYTDAKCRDCGHEWRRWQAGSWDWDHTKNCPKCAKKFWEDKLGDMEVSNRTYTIEVKTTYINIKKEELLEWTDKVFENAAVVKGKEYGLIMNLKKKFLEGEKVALVSCNPESPEQQATTTWEVKWSSSN